MPERSSNVYITPVTLQKAHRVRLVITTALAHTLLVGARCCALTIEQRQFAQLHATACLSMLLQEARRQGKEVSDKVAAQAKRSEMQSTHTHLGHQVNVCGPSHTVLAILVQA